ncbi:MAG TPA: transcription termination/antitermination factor NusG [Candidatus Spyradenecus faecavium]|uniref:Transcription termination/antitermination protein NusG n=1 Tax=Candidatus Spyradenecus faecavium TaxID=2840947 RepID=A0A9D1T367_9BACT|nr:transcription termination/antitermination factor NusG [Candidatus Spyradenecus faecavium]
MADIPKQWFVLQTLTGQEQKAQRQIVAQARSAGLCDLFAIPPEPAPKEVLNDFDVVVPTEKVVEIKDGKKRVVTRRICPGYVIVRMGLYADEAHKRINQELWEFILNIPGVTGFAGCKKGTGQKPRPITDAEAMNLIRRVAAEEEKKPRLKVDFQVGETVRVTEGPFMNFNGTIENIDPDSGRLQISVSIFGRVAPVTLEYWQVERITEHPEGV